MNVRVNWLVSLLVLPLLASGGAAQEAGVKEFGDWIVRFDRDLMTDTRSNISLESLDRSGQPNAPELRVDCTRDGPVVHMAWNGTWGEDQPSHGTVRIRFDREDPLEPQAWRRVALMTPEMRAQMRKAEELKREALSMGADGVEFYRMAERLQRTVHAAAFTKFASPRSNEFLAEGFSRRDVAVSIQQGRYSGQYLYSLRGLTAAAHEAGAGCAPATVERGRAAAQRERAAADRERAAAAESRRREQIRNDSIAAEAERLAAPLDRQNLRYLTAGDTVQICDLRASSEIEGRVGFPDNKKRYKVSSSGCSGSFRPMGEIKKLGRDQEGNAWAFVKIFDPYYNVWIQPRYLWTADNPPTSIGRRSVPYTLRARYPL